MAGRSIDDQLSRIAAISKAPATPEAIAELTKALAGKSNVLAAAAARAAGLLKANTLAPTMSAAFVRFLADGADKGCLAKTAIVKALTVLELEDEATFLAGASHVQREPSCGGSLVWAGTSRWVIRRISLS